VPIRPFLIPTYRQCHVRPGGFRYEQYLELEYRQLRLKRLQDEARVLYEHRTDFDAVTYSEYKTRLDDEIRAAQEDVTSLAGQIEELERLSAQRAAHAHTSLRKRRHL
jgi:hypothetical protein